jgi:hypothetical protein
VGWRAAIAWTGSKQASRHEQQEHESKSGETKHANCARDHIRPTDAIAAPLKKETDADTRKKACECNQCIEITPANTLQHPERTSEHHESRDAHPHSKEEPRRSMAS